MCLTGPGPATNLPRPFHSENRRAKTYTHKLSLKASPYSSYTYSERHCKHLCLSSSIIMQVVTIYVERKYLDLQVANLSWRNFP